MRPISKIKKAFSLFELLCALMLGALLSVLILMLLKNSFQMSRQKHFENTQIARLALIQIEKILKDCVEFNSGDLSCLLENKDFLSARQNQIYLLNSGLVLKGVNGFYVPKARLLELLENLQDLYTSKSDEKTLLFYALKERQIYRVRVLDDERIDFEADSFEGFFKLLEARVQFVLENDKLYYIYTPLLDEKAWQKALLAENITEFKIKQNKAFFELKICIQEACHQRQSP